VATNFAQDAANLFPAQGGTPGTLDRAHAGILRGYVFESGAGGTVQPASGASVSILGHPEYGKTTTRSDGSYEIAVNGGGLLTLNFAKAGTLGAQRAATVQWRDIFRVDDVQLTSHDDGPLGDGAGTAVTPGSTASQIVRGRPVSDMSGARQATLFVPPGTTSSNLSGASWTVHLTEYTVGPNGPQRMPGALPPTSGYTYAFAATIDQAVAAGVSRVEFSQPLPFYVDNFLGFSTGADAPVGSYDRSAGQWVPENSGRVIKIIRIRSPLGSPKIADIDIDGVNELTKEETAAELTAFGISQAEREALAALYAANKTLWRIPVTHFTDYDVNWGIFPPRYAKQPEIEAPITTPVPLSCEDTMASAKPKLRSESKDHASIIECENQFLGESVPVAGTPYSLSYRTDRVSGKRATIRIPLVGSAGFRSDGTENPKRIEWRLSLAGRRFEGQTTTFTANQYVDFIFDGLDSFGRPVQGDQVYRLRVTNVYPANYGSASRFGYRSPLPPDPKAFTVSTDRTEFYFTTEKYGRAGIIDVRGLGLGGWMISPNHVLDTLGQTMYLGDGRRRANPTTASRIDTVAVVSGTGAWIAPNTRVPSLTGLHSGISGTNLFGTADGSILATYGDPAFGSTQIIRLWPDRTATLAVDISTTLDRRNGSVTSTPDGTIYIGDYNNGRIWRVRDGIETVVVMGSRPCVAGETCFGEGPALTAALSSPGGRTYVRAGPDGSLYLYGSESVLRRMTADGQIEVLQGATPCNMTPVDGDAARVTCLPNGTIALAFDDDGGVYTMTGGKEIWRIDRAGRLKKFGGGTGTGGDGGPALNATFYQPSDMVRTPSGKFYILENTDGGGVRVREIDEAGIIRTIAGGGSLGGLVGDDGPPSRVAFGQNHHSLALAPDGTLYISENGHVRRIRREFTIPQAGLEAIVSNDQSEVYLFDENGRHQQTVDRLTGVPRQTFGYDTRGFLSTITDGDGLVTTIARDSTGKPLSITAPHGQVTSLALDANGYLSTIANPMSETWHFEMSELGLLLQTNDVRGGIHAYAYDPAGRLMSAMDPGGNTVRTSGAATAAGRDSTLVTAENLTTAYTFVRSSAGATRTVTLPSGATATQTVLPDESTTSTATDGTVTKATPNKDSRFGMLAPTTTTETTTPGGRKQWSTETRSSSLANPSDPWSVTTPLGQDSCRLLC
jgi:YD repeat-containing protein